MSEISEIANGSVPSDAAAPPSAPVVDRQKPALVFVAAAWVVIVAGVVFIVSAILFMGALLFGIGQQCAHHPHRGMYGPPPAGPVMIAPPGYGYPGSMPGMPPGAAPSGPGQWTIDPGPRATASVPEPRP